MTLHEIINKNFDCFFEHEVKNVFYENEYLLGFFDTTDSIKEHLLFEVYIELIQQGIFKMGETISVTALIKETLSANELEEGDTVKNKRDNAKFFFGKYPYLSYGHLGNEAIDLSQYRLIWKRSSLFTQPRDNENTKNLQIKKGEKSNKNGAYQIPKFQVAYFSHIFNNSTVSKKQIKVYLDPSKEPRDFKNYLEDIKNFLNRISISNENYTNISYYLIEKEYNPLLICNLLIFLLNTPELIDESKQEVLEQGLNTIWQFADTPFIISNDLLIKNVFELFMNANVERQHSLVDIATRMKTVIVLKVNESCKKILIVCLGALKTIYNDGNSYEELLSSDEEVFLRIYEDLGDKIIKAFEKLEQLYIKNSKNIDKIFIKIILSRYNTQRDNWLEMDFIEYLKYIRGGR